MDERIKEFRAGDEYNIYDYSKNDLLLKRSIRSGRPDCFVLNYLENRLQREDEFVALQLVNLLEDLAVHTDPFNTQINKNLNVEMGYVSRLVRDEDTIALLTAQYLKGTGDVKERCYEILKKQVPADLLYPHAEKLLQQLEREVSDSLSYLIAKARPEDSLDRARNLYTKRNRATKLSSQIALAALGDGKTEQLLIDDFLAETKPEDKVSKGYQMAYLGTPAAISALAGEIRSPLVEVVPGALARSIRPELITALRIVLPLAEVLYFPIRADSDYLRVEQYLETKLEIAWRTERPPFLTELPLPPGFDYRDNQLFDMKTQP